MRHGMGDDALMIDVSVHRDGEDAILIVVADNGVGMDPDRAEGDTLGLGLVRTMVREKLNGELTIQSDKGGTTVVFDFIA